jgi:glutamine amidotransferase
VSRVVIVDSGGANLSSVLFAFERLGASVTISSDAATIRKANRVVLPGVGAAGAVMANLERAGLTSHLRALEQPVLGICLGMQILFEGSDEGDVDCLGLLPGRVRALEAMPNFPIPHMGWNRVTAVGDEPLLPEGESAYFYFVHSYAVPAGDHVSAVTTYAGPIPAIVRWRNFAGVQFHPERSGPAGSALLARFLEGA